MERVVALVVASFVTLGAAWTVMVWAMMAVAARADRAAYDEARRRQPVPSWVWDSSEEPWLPPPP
jgi:hypothetical protein